jgi:hypothetical protein
LTPAGQDPNQHSDAGALSLDGKLSGRGCDDLHRDTGLGSDARPDVDGAGQGPGPDPGLRPGPCPGQDPDAGPRPGPPWARLRGGGGERPKARPGWYAYRASGIAELPSWAMEAALAIERPVEPDPQGPAALVLLRALKSGWRTCITDAVAEVEDLAGVGPVAGVDTVAGDRPGPGSRLLMGPVLAGLTPVTPAVAQASLAVAGARGLPAPLRRWRPSAGPAETAWRWSAGAVVTCDGPCGVSAQAVVALGGLGNVGAITPPPGGALVLRAWRAGRSWGVACGLVVAGAAALGLGREAGRVAASARDEGWDAVLLSGPTAMQLARAGGPAQPVPVDAARAASEAQVATLFKSCLAAGGLDRPPAESRQGLSITP